MTLVAGIDLGGTNITVAAVDGAHRVTEQTRRKTPGKGPQAVCEAIAKAVAGLDAPVVAAGVGAPGPIRDGVVFAAPNLKGWSEPVALAERLRTLLGMPVVVDNDATVGAVGEWVAGAGRGARHLLGLWLGTGVGGGLVLEGKPYRGAHGMAGEVGHMVVALGGGLCACGRRGCVEAYAGRASMERAAEVGANAGEDTALQRIRAERGKTRMTSSVWQAALEAKDPLATRLLDEAVRALGAGVASIINLLDLDTVVVGGGLAERLGVGLVDRVADATRAHVLMPDFERRFVLAELGDAAGVIGAAAVARSVLDLPSG